MIDISDCPFYTNGLGGVQCRSGRFAWQLDNERVAHQVALALNTMLQPPVRVSYFGNLGQINGGEHG